MATVDRQRVKEIFAGAIDKPPGERAGFVESACGGDADLRARIDRLLHMHETAGEFLAEPTAGFGAARFGVAGESVGDVIGNYKLLELIGEGGFGTVYLAEQSEPVRRQVALKIIKLGMDTRQVISRFDAEKQAMAVMDHPGIARVFDAGATATGRPYFVMEYVKGVPITQFCDEQNLSPRERLELFGMVCQAIQHAHQKGIIHRDIKPSNVLVSMQDGRPLVKVIDFGIAKATAAHLNEKTAFTEDRQLIGTPQYMSPEQANFGAGDIDTRADIYSLGVLLYELLTGSPPFDPRRLRSAAFNEIQRIIREEDPPRPSTRLSTLGERLTTIAQHRQSEPGRLRKLVRGDLDWIVMKAIEKDRTRRYESASALAADLSRHLRDEPISARPSSTVYHLAKFAKRNRLLVGCAAALLLVILGGVVSTTLMAVRARRERHVAVMNRVLAEQQRQVAEQERQKTQAVNAFLSDLLASASPEEARGRQVTVAEVLDAAAKGIEGQFGSTPAVEASVRSTVGRTYFELGQLDVALSHLRRALELNRQALGEDHPETLTTMNRLAGACRAMGRFDEAGQMYAEVLDKRRRILGPEHRDTLSALHNLAGLYRETGRLDAALPMYQEALELCRKSLPPEDPQLLNAMEGLAGMYKDFERPADAEPLYVQVLAIRRQRLGEDHPQTLRTMNNLAVTYRRAGKLDDAEKLYVGALATQRSVLGEEHPDTIATMTNLGKLYCDMRRLDQAYAVYGEALTRSRKVLGEDHPKTLITMIGLAEVHAARKQFEDAEQILTDAIARATRVLGENSSITRQMIAEMVKLYDAWNKPDKAAQWQQRLPADK
jgi:serine/threonine protein kinase/tetratricopeptide (TPR) repeat protein